MFIKTQIGDDVVIRCCILSVKVGLPSLDASNEMLNRWLTNPDSLRCLSSECGVYILSLGINGVGQYDFGI